MHLTLVYGNLSGSLLSSSMVKFFYNLKVFGKFDKNFDFQTVDKPKDWYKSMFKVMHKAGRSGYVGDINSDYEPGTHSQGSVRQKKILKNFREFLENSWKICWKFLEFRKFLYMDANFYVVKIDQNYKKSRELKNLGKSRDR